MDMSVEYYAQRASAGLIIAEGTQPSAHGKGYCRTPGIHTTHQIASWRRVTDAVHARGGAIVLQLMHCGRIGSHFNKDPGAETIAPSAIRAAGKIYTDSAGLVDFDLPRALESCEIPAVVDEFRFAARNAIEAGFDGVELHVSSGYLPMQFLSTGTNRRVEGYGGALHNRLRFVIEALEAMSAEVGSQQVGFRICPGNPFNDIHDDDPLETYTSLLQAANSLGLAYLHVIRSPIGELDAFELGRKHFAGPLIVNDGFTAGTAQQMVRSGNAEAISFGRAFIANPDLVERFRGGLALADFDKRTLYTPGPAGYIDYPRYPRGIDTTEGLDEPG
jgi:N-ethylmaleimide reductase